MGVSNYSTTPASNTAISGINIAENCNASGINDAIRQMMADIATFAGQTQNGSLSWVAAGGTADAITATYSPALTALVDGQLCFVRASAANATTTPTFAPNGLTARTITKLGGAILAAGDIPAGNAEIILRYNLANTRWELLNPVTSGVLTSAFNGTNLAATYTQCAAVTLTPGKWRLSALVTIISAATASYMNLALSTTTASSAGTTPGITAVAAVISATPVGCGAIPAVDVTVASNTTYYFNVNGNGTGTATLAGLLRAERIT